MSYGFAITLALGFDEAVPRVKEAFKAHGFGTLTEIDVQTTLDEKLGVTMEPYAILGVCNPQLAHQALGVDRSIGLLLPCTVVVRQPEGDKTLVEALDPGIMASVTGHPELEPVAREAARRVRSALAELSAEVGVAPGG